MVCETLTWLRRERLKLGLQHQIKPALDVDARISEVIFPLEEEDVGRLNSLDQTLNRGRLDSLDIFRVEELDSPD